MSQPARRSAGSAALAAMEPEERRRFCRQVFESLSDLVEGEAPEDFCERVDELLADCRPFQAFRNTFEATIRLARRLGHEESVRATIDEKTYERCVERVRRALEPAGGG